MYKSSHQLKMNNCFLWTTVLLMVNLLSAYPEIELRNRCKSHWDCGRIKYAYCSGGRCSCLPGYEGLSRCKGDINATCDSNGDCKDDMYSPVGYERFECILNTCQNYTDFFTQSSAEQKQLYRATDVGSHCETNDHCSNLHHAVCISGKCTCGSGYWNDRDGVCRVVSNATCDDDRNCFESGTECFLNVCMLPMDFFDESNARNISLYVAESLRDPCSTDDHCRNIPDSYCKAGRCACKPDFADDSDMCFYGLNTDCSEDYQCELFGVRCLLDKCLYPKDFFTPSNSHNVNLYAAKSIRGYCQTDHHCRNVNNTHCIDNKCLCKDGYQEHPSSICSEKICVRCSKESDCPSGEQCFLDSCLTPQDFFGSLNHPSLYATKHIGDYCFTEEHCRNLNNSRCLYETCTCKYDYNLISGACIKKEHASCLPDLTCEEPDTHCFIDACFYPQDFFVESNAQNISLYSSKRIFDPCQSDHHCRDLDKTYCHFMSCDCRPGYDSVSGACKQAINVTCSDDSDCLLPRSFCLLNTCLYPEDFLAPTNSYNTSLYAAKRINGFCQTDHHCREIEHSMCLYRRCTCDSQYLQNGDGCQLREPEIPHQVKYSMDAY